MPATVNSSSVVRLHGRGNFLLLRPALCLNTGLPHGDHAMDDAHWFRGLLQVEIAPV